MENLQLGHNGKVQADTAKLHVPQAPQVLGQHGMQL
jgi:hypothetical protein